jgi:hypothetical protein
MPKGLARAVGVCFVAFPIGYSLFGRTTDAERILDRFEFSRQRRGSTGSLSIASTPNTHSCTR